MHELIKQSLKLEKRQRLVGRALSVLPPLYCLPPKLFRPLFLMMDRLLGLNKINVGKVVNYKVPTTSNISGKPHQLNIRAYYPLGKKNDTSINVKSMVYFHGGGCVIGSIATHDRFCRYLAHYSNMVIISVDYRLAPEFKFPIPIYDAIDAWNWVNSHCQLLNIDDNNIGVGGDSAGGYLACLIGLTNLQTELAVKSVKAPSFQFLMYPMLDLQGKTESYNKFNKHLILTGQLVDYFKVHYVNKYDDVALPLISPLQTVDISISPKTFLLTLGYDPLRDDELAYAEKLKKAGVELKHEHYSDCMHGFISVARVSSTARKATESLAISLKKFVINN